MIKIILTGYMGSGKSAVAKVLHHMTGLEWLDLDKVIEEKVMLSVPEIFKLKGEIFFRKTEHLMFRELILSDRSFILSLGGGTPCYSGNHEFLKNPEVFSFYLSASIKTLQDRLANDSTIRPLLASMDIKTSDEFIAKHLFDRSYYYNQAKFKIATDDKSAEEVASEILAQLKNA